MRHPALCTCLDHAVIPELPVLDSELCEPDSHLLLIITLLTPNFILDNLGPDSSAFLHCSSLLPENLPAIILSESHLLSSVTHLSHSFCNLPYLVITNRITILWIPRTVNLHK